MPIGFVFNMPLDNMTLNIDLLFVHADGDLQFDLFRDPMGDSIVPTVNTQTDGENLRLIATPERPLPAGDYYIRVSARGFAENDYGMVVSLAPGLGPDAFEDDNVWERATHLDVNARRGYDETENRTIHAGDEDWFSFPVGLQDGFGLCSNRFAMMMVALQN